jgi:hypothetical protein
MFAKALVQVVDEKMAARPAALQRAEGEWGERAESRPSWLAQIARLFRGPRFVALIPAALLIGLGGAWFVIETSRLRGRLAEALREGETQRRRAQTQSEQIVNLEAQYEQLAAERERLQAQLQTAKEKASPAPAPVFFALSVSAFRDPGGQEPQPLILPRGAEVARLRISLPGYEFSGYQVMLLTADGREVFARNGLRPQTTRNGNIVIVSIPARKFANGDNVISLRGISGAGEVETLGKTIIKVRRR